MVDGALVLDISTAIELSLLRQPDCLSWSSTQAKVVEIYWAPNLDRNSQVSVESRSANPRVKEFRTKPLQFEKKTWCNILGNSASGENLWIPLETHLLPFDNSYLASTLHGIDWETLVSHWTVRRMLLSVWSNLFKGKERRLRFQRESLLDHGLGSNLSWRKYNQSTWYGQECWKPSPHFLIQDIFQHSEKTVSQYFHTVLYALAISLRETIKPPSFDEVPP